MKITSLSILQVPLARAGFWMSACGLALASQLSAQNTGDGSSSSWRYIEGGTIEDSDSDFRDGYELSEKTASYNGVYEFEAEARARATKFQELKAYAKTSLGGTNLGSGPKRINAQSSAYMGEIWNVIPSEIYPGGTISSLVDVGWDGRMTVAVPSASSNSTYVTNPYFNEVGVSVDFRLFEVTLSEEGEIIDEPIPVLDYVSDYLVLRADGKDGTGTDFESTAFDTTVNIYDPSDPWMAPISTVELTLNIVPVVMPLGEIAFDIELLGNLPFDATVGKSYMVNYGMGVYANTTGFEGYAEADFFNTGTVDLEATDPGVASFVVVPEPSLFGLGLGAFLVGFVTVRRRR